MIYPFDTAVVNQGTRPLTLLSSTTKTASFTTDGVLVNIYNEAYIHVDITAFDRGNSDELMTLDVEVSHDNITWVHRKTVVDEVTAGDNTTVTGDPDRGKIKATGDYIVFIQGGLGIYMRLSGTITGTTPSITLSAIGSFK